MAEWDNEFDLDFQKPKEENKKKIAEKMGINVEEEGMASLLEDLYKWEKLKMESGDGTPKEGDGADEDQDDEG